MNFYDWRLLLAETKITFENKEYVLAVGYIHNLHPSITDSLYIRVLDGNHCICGDYIDPYLRDFVEMNMSRHSMSPEFIKFCIDKAERIEKLKAFA